MFSVYMYLTVQGSKVRLNCDDDVYLEQHRIPREAVADTGVSVSELFGYRDPPPSSDSLSKQILLNTETPTPVLILRHLGIRILIALIQIQILRV